LILDGGFLHHAEIVAIGILQLDEVIIGLIPPVEMAANVRRRLRSTTTDSHRRLRVMGS
jgi:hypothetical protein